MFSWKAELGRSKNPEKTIPRGDGFSESLPEPWPQQGVKGHSSTLPQGALGAIHCMCKLRGRFPLSTAAPQLLVGGSCECLLNALCGLREASLVA